MKKFLFLLVFTPLFASAQIEISALGGASLNTCTSDYYKYGNGKATNVMPYGSVKVAYRTGEFNFGLSADLITIKQTFPNRLSGWPGSKGTLDVNVEPYKPGLNLSLFANKVFKCSNQSSFYTGLQAGYIFSLSGGYNFTNASIPSEVPPVPEMNGTASGITFGLQAGYSYHLTQRLSLKAEFAPRFLYSLSVDGSKDEKHAYNTIVLPMAIGFSFEL